MNINAKFLNEILANRIQDHLVGTRSKFNQNPVKGLKGRNHLSILRNVEKAFAKYQYASMIKVLKIHLNLIKPTYYKFKITLY